MRRGIRQQGTSDIYFWYTALWKKPKYFGLAGRRRFDFPKIFDSMAEVRIRRHGSAVILEPLASDWQWLDAIAEKLDDDFVQAVKEQTEQQVRPALEKLF